MENIGEVIRKHRTAKGLSQQELGDLLFVTKQAVSKWETGKTIPDLDTIRKLCRILEIDSDEILGSTLVDAKELKRTQKIVVFISVISFLCAVFCAFNAVDSIARRIQFGTAYLSVFVNEELYCANQYQITSDLSFTNAENGYKAPIDYGEILGTVHLPTQHQITFGFVNTNNWHNVHIRLDITESNGYLTVKQTISYMTDNDRYEVIVTEQTSQEKELSVFREGV